MCRPDRLILFGSALMTALVFGCGRSSPPPQAAREAQAAAFLRAALAMYENDFPGVRITNVAQLFEGQTNTTGYPHSLAQRFRPYGKHAGFTNSIYEKYVVVPSMENHLIAGELVLMSAQAFPDRDGRMQRVLVTRHPSAQIKVDSTILPEERVQQIFREAGVEIPRPPTFSTPPSAPSQHREQLSTPAVFQRLTERLGLPRYYWPNVMIACLGLLVLVVFPALWIWFRRSHR